MAGYPPPPSFGPAPGQRGQAVPFQYSTPQNTEYAYARPSQSTNMSAFEQNATALAPGLEYNARPPPFNPIARNSGAPPLPIYGGMDPSALYQIPVWATQANLHEIQNPLESSTVDVVSGQGLFAMQPESVAQGRAGPSAIRPGLHAVEEGELSEGEYEENNVEGIPGPARGEAGSYNDYRKERRRPSNGTLNQRQSSFEKMTIDPYGRSRNMHRQSSDSYSPPSSGPSASVMAAGRQPDLPLEDVTVNLAHIREEEKRMFSKQNGESITNRQEQNTKQGLDNRGSSTSTIVNHVKSVQDARRQAQNAVLNLIPLKVRFQNFVDEGIDEEIIRSVFDDIGMSSSYSSTKQLSGGIGQAQHTAGFTPQAVASDVSDSIITGSPQIHSNLKTNTINTNSNSQQTTSNAVPITNKGEERKDRIARLLEEKSKKLLNLPQPMAPATAILADNALAIKSTASQSTTKVDKEKLLKQKMEALQKSREARAQKATAKQTTASNVSEEESDNESAEMEIDDQVGDILPRNIQAANPFRPGLRDLPPLPDFPPKKSFAAPSSTLSTPPSHQAPQRTSTRPEDLKKKEFEIQEMRRKIAEAEQRKKAKLVASGSQTPMNKTSTPIEDISAKDASISNKIHTSVHIERLIDDASRRIEEEQEKLARAQELEEHSAKDLKQRESEQRRQRRARIAADLPVVDAEVQESQRRLAGLREEMENLELAVQKRLEEKRRLAEEMEKLSHEVDDQLEAQKDHLISLTSDIAMGQKGDSQVLPEPVGAASFSVDTNAETVAGQQDISMSDYQPSSESPVTERTTTEGLASKEPSLPPADEESSGSQPQLRDSTSDELLPPSNLPDGQSSEVIMAGLPIKPMSEQDAANAADTNIMEPQASQLSLQVQDQLQTPPMDLNIDDTHPPSQQDAEDEVDMEESIADDAESTQSKDREIDEPYPPDHNSISDTQGQNAPVPESLGLESNLASTADGDSDTYEPPEATPPSTTELIATNSPPFSPQSPESTQDASSSDQEMSLAPLEGSTEPAEPVGTQLSRISNDEDETEKAPAQKSFFTPYESPLKRFKAYRFHPEFTKQVPGGYKSLTYSNNIDDRKELCRFELAGGICNDVSCEFQHFRDIVLPDELILVSLGDSSGYKEEDKTRFIKGLKEVLQDLRISKIRDFQVIAAKICTFRRNMFEDSSKVLLLDSPAI
ncbi:hypothetical protein GMDG_00157 [Pseudogymnoascus destructans 20631-21]|uniref:Putative zinc-finger domain-containing protein n=1 Tax=Pseudogymnoascus destructans (strain ATCC MYA-4855 / 20631-21) TaxID=658429 RepID=L8FWP3_PSED2|nr:hypothetical protein GMDG_00157 [Pseudogymnoascus destructans 20631-21]